MRIVVTGSTGLIGQAACRELEGRGHRIHRLVHAGSKFQAPLGTYSRWDPATEQIDPRALKGAEAVLHLAGENLFGYWTAKKKRRIRASRVGGTDLLARTLAAMVDPPGLMLCASAVGYYGDRGDELLDENSDPGTGFLAAVCREWEAAAGPAAEAGIRTAHMRLGIVLTPRGGALKLMLPPFRLGLGGRIGSGEQWVPWVSLDDVVGAIVHLIESPNTQGVYNVTAPNPVTNATLARTLGRVLRRPAVLPAPESVVSFAAGEMAGETVLASTRAVPGRLPESGCGFEHPQLEQALRAALSR